jgi:energy-coupling factor transporter transmembrane protein EcfT
MNKIILRFVMIFWGVSTLFLISWLVYVFFTNGEGSYWLFGARDGFATATTWLDSNADGIQDADEKPLANVCIWYGHVPESGIRELVDPCSGNHLSTDDKGQWWEFLPGGSCNDEFVFTKAPDGFQATTDLAADGCDAKFGFVSEDVQVKQKVISVEDFVRQKAIIFWLKRTFMILIIILISVVGTIWLQKT